MPSVSPSSLLDLAPANLMGSERTAFLSSLSQHARLLTLDTVLGHDALLVERFTGHESLSQLFSFTLDCFATAAHYPLKRFIGTPATLRVVLADGRTRPLHGMIEKAAQLGSDGTLTRYRLTLVPWLHQLTLRRDNYVFQDKSVIEIVEEILSDYADIPYRLAITAPLPKRSLTIQYRESDYDFITRLLTEEGINFFFEHQDHPDGSAQHCLVLFDDAATLVPGLDASIRFHRAHATEATDSITLFAQRRQIGANSVTLTSWDYKKLRATTAQDSIPAPEAIPALEIYEGSRAYRYTDDSDSARIARDRAESLGLQQQRIQAESTVRALAVGTWFTLTDHPDSLLPVSGATNDFTVLSIQHEGANNLAAGMSELMSSHPTEPGTYRNRFTCVPRTLALRPPYHRPKPTAPGVQSALVVGIANEDITTERDHRVKIQFPWQRGPAAASSQIDHPSTANAPGNESAGTWVRVAEPLAGANWGSHFIPRIGQEVLIDFIAGDIDRPVVIGQLYNGADTPPWHSGDNHPGALAGIRSKEMAGSGYNQWVMDDTPGQLRQTLGSSSHASQVHLGYLIRQQGNVRGAYRGMGFEVATDAWSTLRAKRGLFVSTQARCQAISTQLDALEAQAKLKAAGELNHSLSQAAQQHQALPLSTPQALQQLHATISGTESADGQAAPIFTQPVALLDSQAGVSITTPASSVLMAGQDVSLTAGNGMRITAGQAVSLGVAQAASLFTQADGAKVIAANGPVSLQAHTGPMDILADNAMTITSSNGHIVIQAKQEIVLGAGGGYIRLQGADIEIHAPGAVSVKGTARDFLGAGSGEVTLPVLPDASGNIPVDSAEFDEMFHLVDSTDLPLPNTKYRITGSNGQVWEGVTDSEGLTKRIYTSRAVELSIEIFANDNQPTQIIE